MILEEARSRFYRDAISIVTSQFHDFFRPSLSELALIDAMHRLEVTPPFIPCLPSVHPIITL